MTVETLNQKLADIQKQKEQAMANVNALIGAEQMLMQLIQEENENEQTNND